MNKCRLSESHSRCHVTCHTEISILDVSTARNKVRYYRVYETKWILELKERQRGSWKWVGKRFYEGENRLKISHPLSSSPPLFHHFNSSFSSSTFIPHLINRTWNQTWHVKSSLKWNVERTGKCRTSLYGGKGCFTNIVRPPKSKYSFYLRK